MASNDSLIFQSPDPPTDVDDNTLKWILFIIFVSSVACFLLYCHFKQKKSDARLNQAIAERTERINENLAEDRRNHHPSALELALRSLTRDLTPTAATASTSCVKDPGQSDGEIQELSAPDGQIHELYAPGASTSTSSAVKASESDDEEYDYAYDLMMYPELYR